MARPGRLVSIIGWTCPNCEPVPGESGKGHGPKNLPVRVFHAQPGITVGPYSVFSCRASQVTYLFHLSLPQLQLHLMRHPCQ